jgi:hypothetical protein
MSHIMRGIWNVTPHCLALGFKFFFFSILKKGVAGSSQWRYLQPVFANAVRTSNLIRQGCSLVTSGGQGRCSLHSGSSSIYTAFVSKVNSSFTTSEPIQIITVLSSREPTKFRHMANFCCVLLVSLVVGPISFSFLLCKFCYWWAV